VERADDSGGSASGAGDAAIRARPWAGGDIPCGISGRVAGTPSRAWLSLSLARSLAAGPSPPGSSPSVANGATCRVVEPYLTTESWPDRGRRWHGQPMAQDKGRASAAMSARRREVVAPCRRDARRPACYTAPACGCHAPDEETGNADGGGRMKGQRMPPRGDSDCRQSRRRSRRNARPGLSLRGVWGSGGGGPRCATGRARGSPAATGCATISPAAVVDSTT